MYELYLRDDLATAWAGREPFAAAEAIEGEVHREISSRRTLRFEVAGRSYFAKLHRGVGVGEILKNLVVLRRPVVDASNEYRACRHLAERGIAAPRVAGFGRKGGNPATRRSFLITDALLDRESLEAVADRWLTTPPSPTLRRHAIAAVAEIARRMHDAGVNHRDFYLCHLLADGRALADGRIDLAVIDLHRAQIRRRTPRRWRMRDLAALAFSSLDLELTRADRLRFIAAYTGSSIRDALSSQRGLWSDVWRRAEQLYDKGRRRELVKGRYRNR
jgi:heptose I phosphotransferase